MPDRRETMAGFHAKQKIPYFNYDLFLIPDYRNYQPENTEYSHGEDGDFDDEDKMVKIPAHKIVCPTCDGNGKHVNPSIDSHGITGSEMNELGPDFAEDYFSGAYDVTCSECGGLRVILEADRENLDETQKEVLEAYERALSEEAYEIDMHNRGIQF